MSEVMTITNERRERGISVDPFPAIARAQSEAERAAALLTLRNLFKETPHSARSATTGDAYLDEVIPATLFEKALPFLAFFAVVAGCIMLPILEPLAYSLMLLDPLLVALFIYVRSERRQRARTITHSPLRGGVWSLNR